MSLKSKRLFISRPQKELKECPYTAVLLNCSLNQKENIPTPTPPTLRWFIGLHIPLPFRKFFYICKFYIAQIILPYWRLNWWIFHLMFFTIVNKSQNLMPFFHIFLFTMYIGKRSIRSIVSKTLTLLNSIFTREKRLVVILCW